MLTDFTLNQISITALVFVWTSIVRSVLGFGGAALAGVMGLLTLPNECLADAVASPW